MIKMASRSRCWMAILVSAMNWWQGREPGRRIIRHQQALCEDHSTRCSAKKDLDCGVISPSLARLGPQEPLLPSILLCPCRLTRHRTVPKPFCPFQHDEAGNDCCRERWASRGAVGAIVV